MTLEPTTRDTSYGEGRPLVLFDIEPRSYTEAIGGAIAELRPGLDVRVVAPADLPSEIERRLPALVLCDEERPDGCDEAVRWVEYRPYDDPDVVRVDRVAERFLGLDLGDLLGLVDRLVLGDRRG